MSKTEVLPKDLCLLCGELMGDFSKSTKDITNFTETSIESILGELIVDKVL